MQAKFQVGDMVYHSNDSTRYYPGIITNIKFDDEGAIYEVEWKHWTSHERDDGITK